MIITLLCTISCSTTIEDSEEIVLEHAETIVKAIEDRDTDTIKGMFSKEASLEIQDMDLKIIEIFDFCKGKFKTYKTGSSTQWQSDYDNEGWTESCCSITLKTNEDKYVISFIERTHDPNNSDKIGIYEIHVIRDADVEESTAWKNTDADKPNIRCYYE